jgi:predicted acyltransferase
MNPNAATIRSPDTQIESISLTSLQPGRLLSLDLLRGLTIAFMILVNNAGDFTLAYPPLHHALWNGFTPTDLVFPTFLFIVGVTTLLSLSSRLSRGIAKRLLFLQILKRAVILFLLGILVNSFPLFNLPTMRFVGVLQRTAVCYLVVATIYLLAPGWRDKAAITAGILIGYWMLMRFVPVPGYGVPTHSIPLLDRDGNLSAWLDQQIFSAPHLFQGQGKGDPEGLLSTLPAIGTTLLGMLAGQWLRTSRTLLRKVTGIAIAGISAVLLGGLWNFTFPINKRLWTSSYVLFAGGLSLLLLALSIILVVDMYRADESGPERYRGSRFFTPLLVFGTNAIAAYVFSELLSSTLNSIRTHEGLNLRQTLYRAILSIAPDAAFASLLYSIGFMAICWIFTYVLYRHRIFIKI